jgi:hypothetical protein
MPGLENMWFCKASVLQDEADQVVKRALYAAGCKHTSQTPTHRWMWQKELDGCRYSVPQEIAADIQEHADRRDYFNKYPDELSD